MKNQKNCKYVAQNTVIVWQEKGDIKGLLNLAEERGDSQLSGDHNAKIDCKHEPML